MKGYCIWVKGKKRRKKAEFFVTDIAVQKIAPERFNNKKARIKNDRAIKKINQGIKSMRQNEGNTASHCH